MSKAKEVGVKVHNGIGRGFKNIGRGLAFVGIKAYEKGLTPAGHFVTGVVLGERNLTEEQKALAKAKAERMQLDPESKLYKDLVKD